jgi:hypothetical protein
MAMTMPRVPEFGEVFNMFSLRFALEARFVDEMERRVAARFRSLAGDAASACDVERFIEAEFADHGTWHGADEGGGPSDQLFDVRFDADSPADVACLKAWRWFERVSDAQRRSPRRMTWQSAVTLVVSREARRLARAFERSHPRRQGAARPARRGDAQRA